MVLFFSLAVANGFSAIRGTKERQRQWTIQRKCHWDSNTTLSVNLLKDSSNGNSDKKKQSEHFEGQHKQKWPDMCNLFDLQHLKSDDWDFDALRIETLDILLYIYLYMFVWIINFNYPNILSDFCVVILFCSFCYNNLTQTNKNKKCICCTRCLWVVNLIILGAVISPWCSM